MKISKYTVELPDGKTKFFIVKEFEKDDTQVAILSGFKDYDGKGSQYPMLDYDANRADEEWHKITVTYSLKRAIIVESSPNKYWYISFSPLPIGVILQIMYYANCDKWHCARMFIDGYVGIRLSTKNVKGYPRIYHVINNENGKNFYDHDREKAFRKALEKGIDFDKLEVFKGLIKNAKEVDDHE